MWQQLCIVHLEFVSKTDLGIWELELSVTYSDFQAFSCPTHLNFEIISFHRFSIEMFFGNTSVWRMLLMILIVIILKSVFSEIRVRTWVQVISCQKRGLWLADLSGLPILGLFFWRNITWTHVLTQISEKAVFKSEWM